MTALSTWMLTCSWEPLWCCDLNRIFPSHFASLLLLSTTLTSVWCLLNGFPSPVIASCFRHSAWVFENFLCERLQLVVVNSRLSLKSPRPFEGSEKPLSTLRQPPLMRKKTYRKRGKKRGINCAQEWERKKIWEIMRENKDEKTRWKDDKRMNGGEWKNIKMTSSKGKKMLIIETRRTRESKKPLTFFMLSCTHESLQCFVFIQSRLVVSLISSALMFVWLCRLNAIVGGWSTTQWRHFISFSFHFSPRPLTGGRRMIEKFFFSLILSSIAFVLVRMRPEEELKWISSSLRRTLSRRWRKSPEILPFIGRGLWDFVAVWWIFPVKMMGNWNYSTHRTSTREKLRDIKKPSSNRILIEFWIFTQIYIWAIQIWAFLTVEMEKKKFDSEKSFSIYAAACLPQTHLSHIPNSCSCVEKYLIFW